MSFNENQLNILSIDDHTIVQYGLSFLFKEWNSEVGLFMADTEPKIWQCLIKNEIDIIVLDIIMPDIKPKVLVPQLKSKYPLLKIVLYSSVNDYATLHELILLGADAYVNKNEESKVLFKAIETVCYGERFFSENYVKQAQQYIKFSNLLDDLSPREYLVFQLLVEGKGVKEMCNATALQPSTVSTYKNRIFVKLGVENIVELIKIAKENGINV
jgi:two-component system, NarL family, response regulator, fimbrial Z protein, FimZ